jgi:hypothetical protein
MNLKASRIQDLSNSDSYFRVYENGNASVFPFFSRARTVDPVSKNLINWHQNYLDYSGVLFDKLTFAEPH